jgi:hypothetical protein
MSAAAKAQLIAAIRAQAKTPEGRAKLAQYGAGAKTTLKAQTPTPTTRKKRKGAGATPAQRRQRALAAKRLAAKKAAQRRAARIARQRAAKNKDSSPSIPLLVLLAVAPFVLIGLYLLGADYLRRRVPRNRSGGTGGASLEITRVTGR